MLIYMYICLYKKMSERFGSVESAGRYKPFTGMGNQAIEREVEKKFCFKYVFDFEGSNIV